jgi:phage tail sheath gpL-like
MAISDAAGNGRVAAGKFYKLTSGNFTDNSPYAPIKIAILGEANDANQSGLVTAATDVLSAKQAGDTWGYGSPIFQAISKLRPSNGSDGVGGISTTVFAQAAAGSAAAKVMTITPSGTATGNGTHRIVIDGVNNINGVGYDINVVTGDTATTIGPKIAAAINNVLECPVTAANNSGTGVNTCTTKWLGLSANDVKIRVDTGDSGALGLTYTVATTTAGSGSPSISAALTAFGNTWYDIVVVCYPTGNSAAMTALENFNGVPDPYNPTGRYSANVWLPFIAFVGSSADDPTAFTDARKTQCTIALCPAPLSESLPCEIAASYALNAALCAQNTPHLDIGGRYLTGVALPPAGSIPAMQDYNTRDAYVKKGCSTAIINQDQWQVQDFVTTFHPDGVPIPSYRYVRNLFIDFNAYYIQSLLVAAYVANKALINDDQAVTVSDVISPKMWKGILYNKLFKPMADLALIADPEFSLDSCQTGIGSTNPRRMETFYRYKRTETAGIVSTTAEAGFNLGNA